MANIKDLIENPHPIYSRYVDYWRFLINSYEGGVDYTLGKTDQANTYSNDSGIQVKVNGKELNTRRPSNIFQHKKERGEDYKNRVDMSYYYNFCSPIIDIYTNHLFKEPVITEWGNIQSSIDARMDNVDRKGSSIHEFRREAAELAQIYGHIFVLTDKPKSNGDIVSLAQQMEQGMFPYTTFFHPDDVLNWALDPYGQAYWVLLREESNANINPFEFDVDKINSVNYRIWTREEWILFDEKMVEVDRQYHGLGKVPLDIIYNKPSKKVRNYLGISAISDISFIARDVYNKCSELNEIIRNQTFSILCLQGKSNDYDEGTVGTSKALLYPPESNVPQYVSPAADNARVLMDQIDRQVTKMFQLAKLGGGSANQGSEIKSQSGIAKAFDFQETNSELAKKSGHMEDGESRIWNTFARWEGQDEFDGSVSYSRDFNIQELSDDLVEAEQLFKLNLGKEFNVNVKKEILKKKFPRMDEDEQNKMIAEIEAKEGNTEGNSIRSRIPNLFNNASPGGINRGDSNGRANTSANGRAATRTNGRSQDV